MKHVQVVNLPPYDLISIDEPTFNFFRYFLEYTQPRFVVEAGTYCGHFAILAGGVLQNLRKGGRVYSFDPEDLGLQGWLDKNGIETVKYLKESFDDVLTLCPHLEGLCDLVFIDSGPIGEHKPGERDAIRWDHYCIGKKLLRPGGLMLIDDLFGAWTNVELIRKECVLLEAGRGIGLWQKPHE